jgi:hypothetical protein
MPNNVDAAASAAIFGANMTKSWFGLKSLLCWLFWRYLKVD